MSYSQDGEDVWILENLKPSVGVFCEVGAFDGVKSSNTLLFEQAGWTGICIEPDFQVAAECANNRRCKVICAAITTNPDAIFFVNESDGGLSGFGRPGRDTAVKTHRLDELIYQCDLLSVDTEGTEMDVWDSIGQLRPSIVIMEYQTCDEPPQDAAIVTRMTKDGYHEVHRTRHNIIFTR